jgi:hypothetical protein
MAPTYLWYQVRPHRGLPGGMAPVTLTVLSPIWQGPDITIVHPDGWQQTIRGQTAADRPCDLKIFWTEAAPGGPPVCLAIGGDGGIQLEETPEPGSPGAPVQSSRPFLALAAGLIPPAVRRVIGPEPGRSPRLLL